MSTAEQLSRISGGKLWLPLPGGGGVELTNDDIRAALGYAGWPEQARMCTSWKTGVDLVLAKYTMDRISIHALERDLPRIAWDRWWDYCEDSHDMVSKRQITDFAKALLKDFCESEKVRLSGESSLAHSMNVDYRTWKRKYRRPYVRLITDCQKDEADVLSAITRSIGDRN